MPTTIRVVYDPATQQTTVYEGRRALTVSPEPLGPAGARLTAELYRACGNHVTLIGCDR